MYSIGNVVYGTPWNDDLAELLDSVEEGSPLEDWIDEEVFEGFHKWYSGYGDTTPAAFGQVLGEIDVCSPVVVSELPRPTERQMKRVQTDFAKLPAEIRALCAPLDTYIVWSTS